jgi:Uma2 family endonuclease
MVVANVPRALIHLTDEELMRLPGDGRKYELVDGVLKPVPTNLRHDAIVALLCFLLFPFARGRGVLCGSRAGFRMSPGGNLRSPDVSFTRKERLPDGRVPDGFGDVAPDLCVEVISPSEERADMERKLREYFAAGAEQVWHLFPDTQQVTVFFSPSETVTFGSDDEVNGGDLLPGFRSRVRDLFAVE